MKIIMFATHFDDLNFMAPTFKDGLMRGRTTTPNIYYRPLGSIDFVTFNPFVSIGRTGSSKGKVKVRDICLNISFLT